MTLFSHQLPKMKMFTIDTYMYILGKFVSFGENRPLFNILSEQNRL